MGTPAFLSNPISPTTMPKSYSVTLSPRLLPPLFVAALLVQAVPARAGHWDVKGYQCSSNTHKEYWILAKDYTYDPDHPYNFGQAKAWTDARSWYRPKHNDQIVLTNKYNGTTKDTFPVANGDNSGTFGLYFGANYINVGFGNRSTFAEYDYGYPQWQYPPLTTVGEEGGQPGQAFGDVAITAVLEWIPDTNTDYEGNPIPDPPPADVYFAESAEINGFQYFSGSAPIQWTQEHPYKDVHFQFQNVICPFTNQFTYQNSTSEPSYCVTRYKATGKQLTHRDNRDHATIICGPTRKFEGHIALNANYAKEEFLDARGLGQLGFDYHVTPLLLRMDWKAGEKPIAAGAKDTPAHKAKFIVTFMDNYAGNAGGRLANVPLDTPLPLPKMSVDILSGGLGLTDTTTAKVVLDSKLTDEYGRIEGTLTSGNRTDFVDFGIPKKLGDGTKGTFFHMGGQQYWANVEWKLGNDDNTGWEDLNDWGEAFNVGDTDYTKWAYAKLTSVGDKPLTPHTYKFFVHKLVVKVTDPTTGDTTTKFITSNPVEAQQHLDAITEHLEDPSTQVIYEPDLQVLTTSVAAYITPPSQAVSDAEGIVKGAFTVKHGTNFVVDTFGLTLQDQDVLTR
ncbi:hypothetical protein IAD21_06432 (plasmid) [Abditibacteriota bacterium]|nr:hypothetical protein IAD21_06432 [Abditibacteriota bacterium]